MGIMGPPLNKKSFPVGFFFQTDFQTVFTIVYRMIRRLHKKNKISKKKYFPAARVVLFYLARPTGNDFLLKGGLMDRGFMDTIYGLMGWKGLNSHHNRVNILTTLIS